jgi:hypothetical protein
MPSARFADVPDASVHAAVADQLVDNALSVGAMPGALTPRPGPRFSAGGAVSSVVAVDVTSGGAQVRIFPVRLPSGERYWTVVDDTLAVVPAADRFLREERFGRDKAKLTTKAHAGGVVLFLRWCQRTGRDWRTAVADMGERPMVLPPRVIGIVQQPDERVHNRKPTRRGVRFLLSELERGGVSGAVRSRSAPCT